MCAEADAVVCSGDGSEIHCREESVVRLGVETLPVAGKPRPQLRTGHIMYKCGIVRWVGVLN